MRKSINLFNKLINLSSQDQYIINYRFYTLEDGKSLYSVKSPTLIDALLEWSRENEQLILDKCTVNTKHIVFEMYVDLFLEHNTRYYTYRNDTVPTALKALFNLSDKKRDETTDVVNDGDGLGLFEVNQSLEEYLKLV
jgi:hypothetical protein